MGFRSLFCCCSGSSSDSVTSSGSSARSHFRSRSHSRARSASTTSSDPRPRTPSSAPEFPVHCLIVREGLLAHQALFVETQEEGPNSGQLFHMTDYEKPSRQYEHKVINLDDPECRGYFKKFQQGLIKQKDLKKFQKICKKQPDRGIQHEWSHGAVDELLNQHILYGL